MAEEKEEEKTEIKAIDFQCVLLERAHKLAAAHQAVKKYKHVTELGTGGDTGTVLSRIHHGGKTAEVGAILDLCPDVHALLVPFIRISRVDYDDKGKPTGKEKPLHIPNFLSSEDVQGILDGKLGRAPGSGIKSFGWELAGVQPAEVDNNITANLSIYFQSIGDFFQSANGAVANAQAGLDEPSFLDLIINSPAIMKTKKKKGANPDKKKSKQCGDPSTELHKKYEGANFRIKVCAGWALPPNMAKIFPHLDIDSNVAGKTKVQLLQDAIKDTRVSLFLQQVRHDIEFNQNGSLTLNIKYQAALSGIATSRSSNIFMPGTKGQTIETLQDEIKAERAKGDNADQDVIDKKLEEQDKLEQEDRKKKYEKLLQGIYNSNKIYMLKVTIEEMLQGDLSRLSDEDRITAARKRRDATYNAPNTSAGAESDLLTALGSDGTSGEASEEATAQAASRYKDLDGRGFFNLQADSVNVPFIYLGDLLDLVIEQIAKNDGATNSDPGFQFFISEVEFVDMLLAFQMSSTADLKNLSACRDPASDAFLDTLETRNSGLKLKDELYKLISIGDIPISLDAFQAYFIKNVVDKERDKYFFLNFVKDVAAKLITNALGAGCYSNGITFYQRFDTQPLSLYTTDFGRNTQVEAVAKAKSKLGCDVQEADKFGHAMVLFSTDGKGRGLKGVYEDDLAKGIYHHYIGSACGLVKTLNFQREDQAYLREAKIQKHGALGAEQLRELYSVNIDLVGNNLYRNGQYIYVSPLLINTTQQQLNYLGLHGYYLITSVSSKLTPSSFTTSIRALQEGIEFDDVKNAPTKKPAKTDSEPNTKKSGKKKGEEAPADTSPASPPASNAPASTGIEPPPGFFDLPPGERYATEEEIAAIRAARTPEQVAADEAAEELQAARQERAGGASNLRRDEMTASRKGITVDEATEQRLAALAAAQAQLDAAQEAYHAEDQRRAAAGEPSQAEEKQAAEAAEEAAWRAAHPDQEYY